MNPVAYSRPRDVDAALALARDGRFSLPMFKGGGMDVVDHLKEGLAAPDLLIDVRTVGRAAGTESVRMEGGRLRIEGGATLAEIAASPLLLSQAPVVVQAVAQAATPQVRNVATAAGNLLQRPRCWYYRHEAFHCLKKGGATCFAVEGENKYHAIFGGGPCHIVHPSNLAPALWVCDATAHVRGAGRETLPVPDLFHGPDRGVRDEHTLRPGELLTHLTLLPAPRSGFYAIKEKQSFDWPLVLAAVALELEAGMIRSARVCAGAVAPVPWPLPHVERALAGVRVEDAAALREACARAAEGARPMSQNAYKSRLLPVAVRRAVLRAAGHPFEPPAEAEP